MRCSISVIPSVTRWKRQRAIPLAFCMAKALPIGCALAFELSARLGLCAQEEPSRVRAHLAQMGMKSDLSDIEGDLPDADGLLELMAQDKKVKDGQLRFILARGIGEAFVTADVPREAVRDVLSEALTARG